MGESVLGYLQVLSVYLAMHCDVWCLANHRHPRSQPLCTHLGLPQGRVARLASVSLVEMALKVARLPFHQVWFGKSKPLLGLRMNQLVLPAVRVSALGSSSCGSTTGSASLACHPLVEARVFPSEVCASWQ